MDVLVVGSGAREHALVGALRRDADVGALHAAPGNPGIAADVDAVHPLDPADPDAVAALASELTVDLVVIGPELPLVHGAADAVRAAGIACFGPSAAAARLEGSKAFAKEVMAAAGVPTAMAHLCSTADEVAAALDAFGPPYVVKDDGLAAGKGVIVTTDREQAVAHARGRVMVVVEEYLDGPEVSLFCLSDGTTVVPLLPAQDAKRVGDGDTGPNTGGMGAYAPLPWAPPDLAADVAERIARPVVAELEQRGTPFAGLLYVGLALTSRGLRVVEFNVRFGDPETQAVLALLRTPLGALLHATATGSLAAAPEPSWHPEAAVTVVVAAEGYPVAPRTGHPVDGLADAAAVEGVDVHHAGTRTEAGRVLSSGGRVVSVTARAPDLAGARERAYDAVARIRLRGSHHRGDIAARAAADRVGG